MAFGQFATSTCFLSKQFLIRKLGLTWTFQVRKHTRFSTKALDLVTHLLMQSIQSSDNHASLIQELQRHRLRFELLRGYTSLFGSQQGPAAVLPPVIYLDGVFIVLLNARVAGLCLSIWLFLRISFRSSKLFGLVSHTKVCKTEAIVSLRGRGSREASSQLKLLVDLCATDGVCLLPVSVYQSFRVVQVH